MEVGAANTQGLPVSTLEYDAKKLNHDETVKSIIDNVLSSAVVRVHLTATSSSLDAAIRHVRDAAEKVRTTAASAATLRPGSQSHAKTTLKEADAALKAEQAKLDTIKGKLAEWRAKNGAADPADELNAAEDVYDAAVNTGNATSIKTAYDGLIAIKALNTQYTGLQAKVAAETTAVGEAQNTRDQARFALSQTPKSSTPAVNVSPIQEETLVEGRTAGRLSLAAIMLVIAIAAADALFLTRVKFAVPDPDVLLAPVPVPAPPPRPEPVPAYVPEPVTTAVPNRRRYPRRRRERVAASPLDLPNIEVHLLDREGGLRGIQLRNAGGAPATNVQHQQE